MNALERDVQVLKKVLETTVVTQNVQVVRARQQQVEVMLQLTNKIVRNTNSTTVEYYDNYKTVHDYMDGQLPTKLNEAFEKAVIQPLEAWLGSLTEVRTAITEAEKQRVVYDHYKDKTNGLLDSKRKTQLKGKIFDKASEEKLLRNQEKLTTAETVYNEARDGAVGRILFTLENARSQLDMVLLRVMQYEKQVFQECLTCTKSYDNSIAALVGLHKDRKAAMTTSSVDRVVQSIGYARQARENGSKLDVDTFLGSTTKQENTTIGRNSGRNSRSASIDDSEASNTTSMSAFLTAGSNDETSKSGNSKQSTSPAVLAARSALAKGTNSSNNSSVPPKSPGNPFGGHDTDDQSSFTASLAASVSSMGSGANNVAPPPLPNRRTTDPTVVSGTTDKSSSASSSSSGGNASTKSSPAASTSTSTATKDSKTGSGGGMFSSFAKGILRGGNPFAAPSSTTKPDDEIEEEDTSTNDNSNGIDKGKSDLDNSFTRELNAVDSNVSDDPLPPVVNTSAPKTSTSNSSSKGTINAHSKPPIVPTNNKPIVVPSAPDFEEIAHNNSGWDSMDTSTNFASSSSIPTAKIGNKPVVPSNPFGAPTGNDFDPFTNASTGVIASSSSAVPSNPFAAVSSNDDFGFGGNTFSSGSTVVSTTNKGASALPKPLTAPVPSNNAVRTRLVPAPSVTASNNNNANAFGFDNFGSGSNGFDSFGTTTTTAAVHTTNSTVNNTNSWDDFGFSQPATATTSASKLPPKQPDFDPNDPFAGM